MNYKEYDLPDLLNWLNEWYRGDTYYDDNDYTRHPDYYELLSYINYARIDIFEDAKKGYDIRFNLGYLLGYTAAATSCHKFNYEQRQIISDMVDATFDEAYFLQARAKGRERYEDEPIPF